MGGRFYWFCGQKRQRDLEAWLSWWRAKKAPEIVLVFKEEDLAPALIEKPSPIAVVVEALDGNLPSEAIMSAFLESGTPVYLLTESPDNPGLAVPPRVEVRDVYPTRSMGAFFNELISLAGGVRNAA